MLRTMLKSKIHRVIVTGSNLEYEGSIEIDLDLLEKANIREFEQVHVYNITTGERFITYVIKGKRKSGIICVNGAAARRAKQGDIIIICSYAQYSDTEIVVFDNLEFKPKIICVDEKNLVIKGDKKDA